MKADRRFEVRWLDGKREPQCRPNPAYPNGVDLDDTDGRQPGCVVKLPYPARRCGLYVVRCMTCRRVVAVTTAGRPDDPRSVKIACVQRLH